MFSGKQGLNIVQSEIHNVLSVLRRNGRWASNERFYREIPVQFETILIRSFKELRDIISVKSSLEEIDCVTILSPFLHVIQSSNTSARATARSLVSVNKFILYGAVTVSSVSAQRAINLTVESISECQFESSDSLSDEVVLVQLLETLVNLFRSKVGVFISDVNAWRVVETCWKLRTEHSSSTLLRSTAANSLTHVILTVFTRADELISSTDGFKLQLGYGLELVLRILHFLANLTDVSKNSLPTRAFALQLINIVLETASTTLCHDKRVLQVLQGNLCKNLLQNSQSDDLIIFSSTLRVIFNLFSAMRGHLKVQLEVFLISVHFRLATSSAKPLKSDKSSSSSSVIRNEFRELALESLVDFCRQPLMVINLYINYDCDCNCTNLFESMVKTLSECARVKDNRQLNTLNLIAFEGILAIIEQISIQSKTYLEDTRALEVSIEERPRLKREDSLRLRENKVYKRKLQTLVKEFNRKPVKNKWIDIALENGILPQSYSPKDVAKFLLKTSSLDNIAVGDFLSDSRAKDEEWNLLVSETLKEFMNLIDIKGLRIDLALRKVLKEFQLPGEAQKIDRIMEAFGNELFVQHTKSNDEEQEHEQESVRESALEKVLNGDKVKDGSEEDTVYNVFKSADAAYTLAFSIIMLHTDLHNQAIKKEKKMTFEQFKRNNRGINENSDFSDNLLQQIYDTTKLKPFSISGSLAPSASSASNGPNHGHHAHFVKLGELGEVDWDSVLKHSKRVNKSITSVQLALDMKYRFILSDMFNLLYTEGKVLTLLLQVLNKTKDGKYVMKILTSLIHYTTLASISNEDVKYKLILESLASYVNRNKETLRTILSQKHEDISYEIKKTIFLLNKTKFTLIKQDKEPGNEIKKGEYEDVNEQKDEIEMSEKEKSEIEMYSASKIVKILLTFNAIIVILKSDENKKYRKFSYSALLQSLLIFNSYQLLPKTLFMFDTPQIMQIEDKPTEVKRNDERAITENNTNGTGGFWGMISSLFTEEKQPTRVSDEFESANYNSKLTKSIQDLLGSWNIENIFVADTSFEGCLYFLSSIDQQLSTKLSVKNKLLLLRMIKKLGFTILEQGDSEHQQTQIDQQRELEVEILFSLIFVILYKNLKLTNVELGINLDINYLKSSTHKSLINQMMIFPSNQTSASNQYQTVDTELDIRLIEKLVLNIVQISSKILINSSFSTLHDFIFDKVLSVLFYLPDNINIYLASDIIRNLEYFIKYSKLEYNVKSLDKLFYLLKYYSRYDITVDKIYNDILVYIVTNISQYHIRVVKQAITFIQFYILPSKLYHQFSTQQQQREKQKDKASTKESEDKRKQVEKMISAALPYKKPNVQILSGLKINLNYSSVLSQVDSENKGEEKDEDEALDRKRKRLKWLELRNCESLNLLLNCLFELYDTFQYKQLDVLHNVLHFLLFLNKADIYKQSKHFKFTIRKLYETLFITLLNKSQTEFTEHLTQNEENGNDCELGEDNKTHEEERKGTEIHRVGLQKVSEEEQEESNILIKLSSDEYIIIFNNFLIPIIDKITVDDILKYNYEIYSLFYYIKLILNLFLHKISDLAKNNSFSILWLKIITLLCKNIKIAKYCCQQKDVIQLRDRLRRGDSDGDREETGNSEGSEIYEMYDKVYFTSIEGVKNMVMVLKIELKWEEEKEKNLLKLTFDLIKTTSKEVYDEVENFFNE